jgi:hypothetical protein
MTTQLDLRPPVSTTPRQQFRDNPRHRTLAGFLTSSGDTPAPRSALRSAFRQL